MSADEIKAAMRAAEDEGDAAAAVAVEREAAAEMDEFTKVPCGGFPVRISFRGVGREAAAARGAPTGLFPVV